MKKGIYTYIKNNIDDSYILDVIYYCLRHAIEKRTFEGLSMNYFKISKKFIDDDISLTLYKGETMPKDILGVLLSVRAIILDKTNLGYCYDDGLIFCRYGKKEFGWLDYANLINMYNDDEEFHLILRILSDIVDNIGIEDSDKQRFISQTRCPEYRNIRNYYKEKEYNSDANKDDMILGSSHICDDAIEYFEVAENIGYVGNTAFAYCSRLKEIKFLNPNVVFGKFPILECNNIKRISVPYGSLAYYQKELPYYKDIIVEEEENGNEEPSLPQPSNVAEDMSIQSTISTINISDETEFDFPVPTKSLRRRERIKTVLSSTPIHWAKEKFKDSLSLLKKKEAVSEYDLEEERTNRIKASFSKKVTTYKYFWFVAILKHLESHDYNETMSKQDLTEEMIVQAWDYVGTDTHFPNADQIPAIVNEMWEKKCMNDDNETDIRRIVQVALSNDASLAKRVHNLGNNAPYRFLSPWIIFTSTKEVESKSLAFNNDSPYSINGDEVIMNPSWRHFFDDNSSQLKHYVLDCINKIIRQ